MSKTYEDLFTSDAIQELEKHRIRVPKKVEMTCNGCPDVETCEFAWDIYNTDGDCLGVK